MAKYVIEKYNIKYRNLFLLVFLGSKLIILANHKSNVTLKVYALFQPKLHINRFMENLASIQLFFDYYS